MQDSEYPPGGEGVNLPRLPGVSISGSAAGGRRQHQGCISGWGRSSLSISPTRLIEYLGKRTSRDSSRVKKSLIDEPPKQVDIDESRQSAINKQWALQIGCDRSRLFNQRLPLL